MVGSRLVSSTFSEYREGHYHAGIDIRTFGRTGFPVVAVDDGYVRRLKISPFGYGKALYLKLYDGNTAVYAHLDGFDRACDSLAYYWRLRARSSYCDLRLEGKELVYSAGDTLGFTGKSGTSAPHLHFEIRDSAQRPFNPLLDIYRIQDTTAPIIAELVVYPLDVGSLVELSPLEKRYYFDACGGKCFVLPDTLELEGCFGFGATIWDEQGYGEYYLAPFEVGLKIDGVEVYRKRNEKFSYDHTRDVEAEFRGSPTLSRRNTELLFNRWRISRRDRVGDGRVCLAGSNGCIGGAVELEKGLHRAEITASDANGNTATAVFYFRIHKYPVLENLQLLRDSDEVIFRANDPDGGDVDCTVSLVSLADSSLGDVALRREGRYLRGKFDRPASSAFLRIRVTDDEGQDRNFLMGLSPPSGEPMYCEARPFVDSGRLGLKVSFDRMVQDMPSVRLVAGDCVDTAMVYRLTGREVVGLFGEDSLFREGAVFQVEARGLDGSFLRNHFAFTIMRLKSGSVAGFELGGERAVRLEAPSLRAPMTVIVREVGEAGRKKSGLNRVAPIFDIQFERDVLLGPFHLCADFGDKTALYRWDKRKGWTFVGGAGPEGGRAAIDRPGIYGFFRDELPPVTGGIFTEKLRGGSGFFRNPWIYCKLDDRGSGIDPYSTFVEINGRWAVSEWDDFRKRLYIPLPEDGLSGPVHVRVDVSDRVGNRSLGEYEFLLE